MNEEFDPDDAYVMKNWGGKFLIDRKIIFGKNFSTCNKCMYLCYAFCQSNNLASVYFEIDVATANEMYQYIQNVVVPQVSQLLVSMICLVSVTRVSCVRRRR